MKPYEYRVIFQIEGKTTSEDAIDFTEAKKHSRDTIVFSDFVNRFLVSYVNTCINRFENANEDGLKDIVVHIPKKLANSAYVKDGKWCHPMMNDEYVEIKCDATDESIAITANRVASLKLSGKRLRLRTSSQSKARFELQKVALQCHPEDLKEFCKRTLAEMEG